MTLTEIAEVALSALEATPPTQVFAGRKGICAFANHLLWKGVIGFRRKGGKIRMEVSDKPAANCSNKVYLISAAIQKRAARIIDSLP